jgi:hypothetical protein
MPGSKNWKEDKAMNDDKPQEIQPSEPDEKIEAPPNPPQPGKWQMPKPVFKKTSGYLPQGFEKAAGFGQSSPKASAAPAAEPSAPPAAADELDAPVESAVPVGEQPDFLEHLDAEEEVVSAAPMPAKKSNPAFRIVIAVVIFFLVAAFIAGFLYLIYFLFLSDGAVSL